ncbi:HAUS augmin-like complex subunit 7 [Brachionichthys hirsutus]|uniref:HAUS augmin-like complex subunit 7 n=1 Tax=Brachionichthys hirsutus TaxID=412623 RepID=UPI003604C84E
MAGSLKEKTRGRRVYDALQAASCPWVTDPGLQEDEVLQLLTRPSQHRTNILAWTCCSINRSLCPPKEASLAPEEHGVFNREMALLGRDLLLCRAEDLDLIEGSASVHRQLTFLEQLLAVVSGGTSARPPGDAETLLDALHGAENLPHLSQMLEPTLQPWTGHVATLVQDSTPSSRPRGQEAAGVLVQDSTPSSRPRGQEAAGVLVQDSTPSSRPRGQEAAGVLVQDSTPSSRPRGQEAADVSALLQATQSALQELQSECGSWNDEAPPPSVFSPGSLRVAALDLQQLIGAFGHVFGSDLRACCSLEARSSYCTGSGVFQSVHRLLRACVTELELMQEVSEASRSLGEDLEQLQRRGQRPALRDQLEELSKRAGDFLSLLGSC